MVYAFQTTTGKIIDYAREHNLLWPALVYTEDCVEYVPTDTENLAPHEIDIMTTAGIVLDALAARHLPEPQYNRNLLRTTAGINHGGTVELPRKTACVVHFFANDDFATPNEQLADPEGMNRFRDALEPGSPLGWYLDFVRPRWREFCYRSWQDPIGRREHC